MDFVKVLASLLGFLPLGVLTIVAKEPRVDGRRAELTRTSLVAAVSYFVLRNYLQPKILWRFSDLDCFLFSHAAVVNEVGIGGILVASL